MVNTMSLGEIGQMMKRKKKREMTNEKNKNAQKIMYREWDTQTRT